MTDLHHASEDPRLLRSQLTALQERNAVLEAIDERRFHEAHDMTAKLAHLYHDLELARAEIEQMTEELQFIKESHQHVMAEECPTDEVHCACVPVLRAEIERLRGENMTCPRCGAKGEGRQPPACFDCTDRVKAELEKLPKLREAVRLSWELKAVAVELRNALMAAMRVILRAGATDAFLCEASDAGVQDELGTRSQAAIDRLSKFVTDHDLLPEGGK